MLDDKALQRLMGIAWARELNSEDSLIRFTAQMGLYNNLIKLGFYPYYASRMAHGRTDCCYERRDD